MKPFNFLINMSYRALLCLFMVAFPYLAKAQSTQPLLFNDTPTATDAMTSGQLATYNKLTALGDFSEIRVIQFNALASAEQDGVVKVNIVGGLCGEVTFRPVGVNYNSEDDYFYYGRMDSKSGCDCTDGEISITKLGGAVAGDIRIGDSSYSVVDLGDGKQVLGKSPDGSMANCPGAAEDTFQDPGGEATGERSGTSCNIRVLVMVSSNLLANKPQMNVQLVGTSGLNQLNQAVFNSQIGSSNANFILAGPVVIAPPSFDETGITTTTARSNISTNPDAVAMRNAAGADIVALFVDPGIMSNADSAAGVATLGGRWTVIDHTFNASTNRVFVHEMGHLMRANHEPCAATDPGPGCLNNGGPAHGHTFTTGCDNKKRKTAMYSRSSSDQILHFSNPNVNFSGAPTGITGTRDNASVIRGFGCTAANHSTLFDDAFFVNISGPQSGCKSSWQTYTANVSGNGLGSLTYEWRMAIGGVSYGAVFSTNSFVTIQLPATTPNMVSLRVKVTSSLQGIKEATNYINVANCGGLKPDKPTSGTDKIITVNAYPNPSQGDVHFEVTASEDIENGRLTIFDQYGKVVRTVLVGSVPKLDAYNVGSINGLPTGLYSYQLSFSNEIKAGKFSVVR